MKKLLYRLAAVFVLLFLFSCGSGSHKPAADDNHGIRVMTYNIHHCNPPYREGVIDVDAIAAVIATEGADVVALQEVDVNTGRSGGIDQAALLAEKAGYPDYYFGKAMDYDGGQYGIMILSKYPLSETSIHKLPMAGSDIEEPRVLTAATVTLPGGKTFRFGTVHLEAYNDQSRVLQAKEICRIAAETEIPFILAGDLNAYEGDEAIRIFDEIFARTCRNCPPTFDEEGETGAIDFILFYPADALKVLKHEVIQNREASDHMPVIADLEWVEN
ncbi:MAG: endonuclease/exonuclease/phosphatase family protein [Bacteroidales bacterium]